MENETVKHEEALRVAIDEGRVSQVAVASDGTITVAGSKVKLQSVDVADVDLVLGFEDGTFIIIPYGALDALSEAPPKVHFVDAQESLAVLFKMVGIINPAKAGSLRVVTDNVDAAKPPADEREEMAEAQALELPAPPAPLARVSAGTTSGGKGPGKGAGLGGSGEGEGEVQESVVPLAIPQPAVYRVGTKQQISVEDLLNGLGLGEQPNFTQTLYTSSAFKLTPSGRVNLPAGSYDANLTSAQKEDHSSPAGQSTREAIYGTTGVDTIDHNSAFSSAVSQWSKTLHLDFNNFSAISSIQIVFNAAKMALIPGFDIQGAGVTRTAPNSNTWNITPSADIFGYGQDIQVVYTVSSGAVTPVDFGADITVAGDVGPLKFELTNNLIFTWRDALTEADFTVSGVTGALMMVLPSSGVGIEAFADAGNDTVFAGAGHDILHGETGDDNLYGGIGNDLLDGGAGADAMDGGQGVDTATYINSAAGVAALLDSAGTGLSNTNEAAGDTYVNVENLTGSNYDDILVGDANTNILTGGLGNDTLTGRGNGDTLDGGDGFDTAGYAYATNAITVSLTSNTGTLGEADGDILISIENLIGGSGNDTFTGAAGIQANAFDGGAGSDTVSYVPSTAGVVATLTTAFAHGTIPVNQTNDAWGDTYTSIENLTGTFYDDVLIGNVNVNILTGGRGQNVLEGMGGGDTLVGSIDIDTVSYDHAGGAVVSSLTTGLVLQAGDAAGDIYASIENMVGSEFSDTLIGEEHNNAISGGQGDDILEGMGGNDTLIGGTGTDTASYLHANSYVYASLTTGLTGFVAEGHAAGDSYDSIENLIGSDYNDVLIGSSIDNTITGGLGDDTLEGMNGNDSLLGGDGSDTASYAHAAAMVTASLANPGDNLGDAAINDSYSSIENLLGSAFDDTLIGDGNDNVLTGGAGNDSLLGGAGEDILWGGTGDDTLSDDGVGAAGLYGEAGDDTLILTSQVSGGTNDVIDG
ncbi:MAG: calcium-binding protein, partial [Chlorobium sp.]|nr:calcium-binding protein [Chlorobium sp.]